ncbi:MAG TPA: extracellular solute-binding protein [Anaerolineales bacterium]|nr:extracellular solute-binding protein [Anaerolineales bacterium]
MELNFLTIADTPEDLQPLRGLLASFEREKEIQLSLRRVGWDRAWQILLMEALEGKGPHVSQLGSTWVPTMAMLDALRAFSPDEVSALGGASCFLPSAWESVKFADRPDVWAIPWSIYTFVLYYRGDLLEKTDIEPDTAFVTSTAMRDSFTKLSANGIAPWAFPSLHPYADLVHIASSWVRANGGDFMSRNGRDPLFASPQASSGLMDFFELFPFIPLALRGLNVDACTNAFARGDVAVLIGGVEIGNDLMESPYASQEMRENVAVTTLPGVPWIGGDHLAIWKNVLADTEHERAALDLVNYLSRRETQTQLFLVENILPARMDAYSELTFPLETTKPALEKILQTGRPHPALRLWRRIEAFLDEMLLDIGKAVLRQPTGSPSDITLQMLKDYEQRLSAVLKG